MIRWAVVMVVLAASVGYLLFSATQGSAEYYQTLAELRAHPSEREVRVIGTVDDDVQRTEGGLAVRFTARDGSQTMPVYYRGSLPDIFQPGVHVVVEGRLGRDGVFHARAVQAKCPSRFSSA